MGRDGTGSYLKVSPCGSKKLKEDYQKNQVFFSFFPEHLRQEKSGADDKCEKSDISAFVSSPTVISLPAGGVPTKMKVFLSDNNLFCGKYLSLFYWTQIINS